MPDQVTTPELSDVRHDVSSDEETADAIGADAPTADAPSADDDHATVDASEAADDAPPAVDRGECPICGAEFDDRDVFRMHLGEVHDLFDDEGATTTLWVPAVITVEPIKPVVVKIPEPPVRARAVAPPPPPKASTGLVIFVVLLIIFGGGLVYSIQTNNGSKVAADEPALASLGPAERSSATLAGTTGSIDPSDPSITSDPSTSSGSGGATGSQPSGTATLADGTPLTADTSGGSTVTDPATGDTTPSPTTVPPPPPPIAFVAPTTSGAQLVSCTKDKGQWIVTYSWQFVGGSAWQPLASYDPLGGGWYQHRIKMAPNSGTQITKVGVLDSNGTRYNVALSPALTPTKC